MPFGRQHLEILKLMMVMGIACGLWYSLAAALSHHSGKLRSHRQVCALTTAYLSRFEADFALLGMELALRVNRLQAILPSISNLWKKFALGPEH